MERVVGPVSAIELEIVNITGPFISTLSEGGGSSQHISRGSTKTLKNHGKEPLRLQVSFTFQWAPPPWKSL